MTSPGDVKMAAEAAAVGAGTDNNANMPGFVGSALLVVIGEPFTGDHRELVLERITTGLKSWDVNASGCDINAELQAVATAAPPGEDGLAGERFIEHTSDQLHTEILVNPHVQTVSNKIRSFLLTNARYRYLLYVGHAIQGSGEWLLQDDCFTFTNFAAIGREPDVENALKQQDPGTMVISTFGEGDWNEDKIAKQNIGKILKVMVNPTEKVEEFNGLLQFTAYLSYFIKVRTVKDLLRASDVVGNIRFSRPTLYIFPGSQGDSALFGISGFNLLINGGYSRKACFWDFTRHLDRIDAVLLTHLAADNLMGISTVLERKAMDAVHPEIGYMYMNAIEKVKHSPNGDSQPENGGSHKPPSLLVNLAEEGNRIVENLRQLGQTPSPCIGHMSGQSLQPINLYHKVGHGSLDMYVVNPYQDSKELKDFFSQWNKHVNHFTNVKNKVGDKELSIPLPSMVSISSILVWRPSSDAEKITRIFFPGSAPQNKLFEGLDRLKTVDIFQHESCSEKGLHPPKAGARKAAAGRAGGRASTPKTTPPPASRPEPKKSSSALDKRSLKAATPPRPEKVSKEEKNTKRAASKKSPASSAASTKTPTPVTSPGEPSPKAITPEPVVAVKEEPVIMAQPAAPVEQTPPTPPPPTAPVEQTPPTPPPPTIDSPPAEVNVKTESAEIESPLVDTDPVQSQPALDDLLGGPAPEGQTELMKPVEVKEEALMPEADQIGSQPLENKIESPEPLPDPAEEVQAPVETSLLEEPPSKLEPEVLEPQLEAEPEAEPEPVVASPSAPEPAFDPLEDLVEPVKDSIVEAAPEPVIDEPVLPSEPCLAPEPEVAELESIVPEVSSAVEAAPAIDLLSSLQGEAADEKKELEELGIFEDDEKDMDTAVATDPSEPSGIDGGIPAVMTQSMYDDLGIYDDEPESAQSDQKVLEDLGIYDEPEDEQASAVVPKDVDQSAASQEPEADQVVFGGAAPEGLPEPQEPVLEPVVDEVPQNLMAEQPDLLGLKEASALPDIAATTDTLVQEEVCEVSQEQALEQEPPRPEPDTQALCEPATHEGEAASEGEDAEIDSKELEKEVQDVPVSGDQSQVDTSLAGEHTPEEVKDSTTEPQVESSDDIEPDFTAKDEELAEQTELCAEPSDEVPPPKEEEECDSQEPEEVVKEKVSHEPINDQSLSAADSQQHEEADKESHSSEPIEDHSSDETDSQDREDVMKGTHSPEPKIDHSSDETDSQDREDVMKDTHSPEPKIDHSSYETDSQDREDVMKDTHSPEPKKDLVSEQPEAQESTPEVQPDVIPSVSESVEEDIVQEKQETLETEPGEILPAGGEEVPPVADEPIEPEQAALPLHAQFEQREVEVDSLDQDDDLFARDITPDPTEKMVSPESATESEQAMAVDQDGYPESVDSVEKIPADTETIQEKASDVKDAGEEELMIGEPQCGLDQLQELQGDVGTSVNPFSLVDGPTEIEDSQLVGTNPFLGVSEDGDIPHSNGPIQAEAQPFDISEKPLEPAALTRPELRGEDLDRDSLEREEASDFDPLKNWGQPMGLPAPPPPDSGAADDKKPASARSRNGTARKPPTPKKADIKKTPPAATAKPAAKKTAGTKPATKPTSNAKPASAGLKREPKKDPRDIPNGKKESTIGKLKNGTSKDPSGDKMKNEMAKEPRPSPGKAKNEAASNKAKSDPVKKPPSAGLKKTGRPTTTSAPAKSEPVASRTATKPPASKRLGTGAPTKSAPTGKTAPPIPVIPFYVDLTYVPHHGDAHFTDATFFNRIRARYYVISSLNPSPATLNALLEAKQHWDNSDAEVTIIPTYDTDTLRHWMGLHRDTLSQLKIDVAPSASRCTIQLQDHETSCAAYRLEF